MLELSELPEEVYFQLKRLAAHHLRTYRQGGTLNCTALVHEAFLKLQSSASTPDGGPGSQHYMATASLAMRHILVDHVRRNQADKRGGNAWHVTLQDSVASQDEPVLDLLALDDALKRLGQRDKLLEQVVVLRFFAGLNMSQTAEVLGRSVRSTERDWARARTYLFRELEPAG